MSGTDAHRDAIREAVIHGLTRLASSRGERPDVTARRVEPWTDALEDLSVPAVAHAFRECDRETSRFPSPPDIRHAALAFERARRVLTGNGSAGDNDACVLCGSGAVGLDPDGRIRRDHLPTCRLYVGPLTPMGEEEGGGLASFRATIARFKRERSPEATLAAIREAEGEDPDQEPSPF